LGVRRNALARALFREHGERRKRARKKSSLFKKIVEEFGSFEHWEKDFKAMGVMRGVGWVVLRFGWQAFVKRLD